MRISAKAIAAWHEDQGNVRSNWHTENLILQNCE